MIVPRYQYRYQYSSTYIVLWYQPHDSTVLYQLDLARVQIVPVPVVTVDSTGTSTIDRSTEDSTGTSTQVLSVDSTDSTVLDKARLLVQIVPVSATRDLLQIVLHACTGTGTSIRQQIYYDSRTTYSYQVIVVLLQIVLRYRTLVRGASKRSPSSL